MGYGRYRRRIRRISRRKEVNMPYETDKFIFGIPVYPYPDFVESEDE